MAKVYPYIPSSSSTSSSASHDERDIFTIWMKSLVMNGNGYTVFDSSGKVVYRIDNYDSKCCSQVYLMDLQGKVLTTILRKKLLRSGLWDGYKSDNPRVNGEKPWFRVRKESNFRKRDSTFHVAMGFEDGQISSYKMEGSRGKSDFKIIDNSEKVVAEAKQKQSSSGVVLGKDVLILTVEPLVDRPLIMALVAVYGLIRHKM